MRSQLSERREIMYLVTFCPLRKGVGNLDLEVISRLCVQFALRNRLLFETVERDRQRGPSVVFGRCTCDELAI